MNSEYKIVASVTTLNFKFVSQKIAPFARPKFVCILMQCNCSLTHLSSRPRTKRKSCIRTHISVFFVVAMASRLSKFLRLFGSPSAHSSGSSQKQVGLEPSAMSTSTKSGEALAKLRKFGYAFNTDGELRKIDKGTGEPGEEAFEFNIYNGDQAKNQQHYEELADQIPEIVYDLLKQQGLSRTYIPEDLPTDEATFIFTHPQKLEKSKKLLVLIHGSGFVRAGQWARSLIINNSIDHGTQIPYIKRGMELGYDILVTNTNDNFRTINGKRTAIPKLNSPTAHAAYVWENYIIPSQPESVAIVAHSYGGAITLELAKRFPKFFKKKVFAIALTDSAHFSISNDVKQIVGDIACNWASSDEPLDTPLNLGDIKRVSAGHPKHEWSSYSAFEAVFKYLEEKYADFTRANGSKKPKLDSSSEL